MTGSKIISKSSLTPEELAFSEQFLAKIKIAGAFLGAVRNHQGLLSPVLLQGRQLRLIKLSSPITPAEKILLTQQQERYQELKKFYPDEIVSFGIVDHTFYYLRDFHRSTLSEYLEANKIKVSEANNFVMKILNLVLDLKRINFPHGHLTPNNLIIDEKNLSLVDFGFAYNSCKHSARDLVPSEYLAPESRQSLMIDFASDIYSFGKIIKFLYHGLQCPIPLDLPDRMCDPEPRKRPSLIEINNQITDTFTQKRNKTEHWSNAPILHQEIDPSKIYKGYLSPAILEQIRQEFSKTMQLKEADPQPTKAVAATESKAEDPTPLKVTTPNKLQNNPALIGMIIVCILFAFYLWNERQGSEEQNIPQETTISAVDPSLPEPVQLAIRYLEEKKIPRAKDFRQILVDLYNANYQTEKLTALISPLENEETQLVKLQALVLLTSHNPKLLELIFQDLTSEKILKSYLDWYQSNAILKWDSVNGSIKLLIIAGTILDGVLSIDFYFDLSKHFSQEIKEATYAPINNVINNSEQRQFYLTILKNLDAFPRESLSFLNTALGKEKDLQLALLDQWFKNTKPSPELIFKLVAVRKLPKEGEDYFSFYAARYLKDYLQTLNLEQLAVLKDHHETQLQAAYQIKKSS